jgi:imidazolonepropionase
LSPFLGAARSSSPRLVRASLEHHRVVLAFDDGSQESVPDTVLTRASDRARTQRRADLVVKHAGVLLTADGDNQEPLGAMRDGAVISGGGRILWVGPSDDADRAGFDLSQADIMDAAGRLVTPGLIDCHSHPIFAGNRADEFAMRAQGKSYLEIAAAGGGIVKSTRATRAASFDELVALGFERMDRAHAAGTTTAEAKSGYDLTVDGELRLLEVAQAIDALHPVDIDATLLGAHVVPTERKEDRQSYVADVVQRMIPQASERGLCRAVDVYCDVGAFTLDETRQILGAAKKAGLAVRGHIGQFSNQGAAELLAELGALSADHLEFVSDRGISAMAAHGVVAVMLPGACTQLNQTPPPIEKFRAAGVPMAVATDMNPGTTMGHTLPLQMWLACTRYLMTVEEAWLGVTKHAARAMGRVDVGTLTAGAITDLVIWDAESPAEIPYRYDDRLQRAVIKSGRTS